MTALAIRKTTVDGLSARNRKIMQLALRRLELGSPAVYNDGTRDHYIWDDPRIDLIHLAVIGCLAANLADIPAAYDPDSRTREQLEDDIRQFLAGKLVRPDQIAYAPDGDVYQQTLDANGAPVAVRAASSVPANWTAAA